MGENEIKNYFGRKVAIDASMSLYQFLIAVRADGGAQLTNEAGETTSHLMGVFYRTIRMIDNGIKPIYVFDGKPPDLKSGELEKRAESKAKAEEALQKAKDAGDHDEIDGQNRRSVRVTKTHNAEAQELLKLMGVPFVLAPCEAEAQCAELVKSGKAFAVGTEDMDALTFGSNVMLRHLTFSEARKMPIKEFRIDRVLEGFKMNMSEFIDLCILLGCDYCDKIKAIGPKNAIKLIQEHKSIEKIIEHLDGKKNTIPENWNYKKARELFHNPEVTPAKDIELKWENPDEEKLVEFMCQKNGFNEERIRSGAQKLLKARKKANQGRMDSFFKVLPKVTNNNNDDTEKNGNKRKADDTSKVPNKNAKAGKNNAKNANPKSKGKAFGKAK